MWDLHPPIHSPDALIILIINLLFNHQHYTSGYSMWGGDTHHEKRCLVVFEVLWHTLTPQQMALWFAVWFSAALETTKLFTQACDDWCVAFTGNAVVRYLLLLEWMFIRRDQYPWQLKPQHNLCVICSFCPFSSSTGRAWLWFYNSYWNSFRRVGRNRPPLNFAVGQARRFPLLPIFSVAPCGIDALL